MLTKVEEKVAAISQTTFANSSSVWKKMIKIPLKIVPDGQIDNNSVWVQVIA